MRTLHRSAGSLVLALTALVGCGTSSASHLPVPTAWTWTAFSGSPTVHVKHPVSWRFVDPPPPTPAPWATLGYLTNEPAHAPCVTTAIDGGYQAMCRGPVSVLSPGGVVVTISGSQFASPGPHPTNATIDGHRVDLQSTVNGGNCPTGTTGRKTVEAFLANPHSMPRGLVGTFTVEACYNASGAGAGVASDVDRMVHEMLVR